MMQRSKIEYLKGPDGKDGFTWNHIKMRCAPISPGCRNCWHLRFAKRHAANLGFDSRARDAYEGGLPFLDEQELIAPARHNKPARIAVQFMGDLFESHVTDYQIESVISVMARLQVHTFLVLTRRPERMLEMFEANNVKDAENIWAGVSVEDCNTAAERMPVLRKVPAALRWVSIEPMLEGFRKAIWTGIDWVVCGAETGPGKRPCRQEWIDDLRTQVINAGIPFFGKVDEKGHAIIPRMLP